MYIVNKTEDLIFELSFGKSEQWPTCDGEWVHPWKSKLSLPTNYTFLYKYAKGNDKDIRLERGPYRKLTTTSLHVNKRDFNIVMDFNPNHVIDNLYVGPYVWLEKDV